MKKKILVLGNSGLIGHQVFNYLQKFEVYSVYGLSKSNKFFENTILLNLRDELALKKVINNLLPDIIINCAGVLIESSNLDPENAIYLNSYLPHSLNNICTDLNIKFIHISTDCVFSGDRGNYSEDDYKDGRTIYAKTKGLGEFVSNKNLIIRTSVIGPELKNDERELFNWFMNQKNQIFGFEKSIWSGLTTIELSKVIKIAIENNIVGLYNVTTEVPINKYDLLILLNKYSGHNIDIVKSVGVISDKSLIDNRKEINFTYLSYDRMIFEMFEFIYKNKQLYNHYF
jgi:dTDP-4-dehydrorhamnose reductase